MQKIFNKELGYRILSLIIFIPIMIVPIIYSNILLTCTYLVFNSIVLKELLAMKSDNQNKIIVNIYLVLITFTFFMFISLTITGFYDFYIIIQIIVTIWLFDTFSYLGGKVFRGRKLMPKISKGKTISGLLVGIVSTIIILQTLQIIFQEFLINSFLFTSTIIIFAFLGDLSASLLKRIVSIKDSGSIMPGHGGLLDRLDSFLGVFFILGIFNLL